MPTQDFNQFTGVSLRQANKNHFIGDVDCDVVRIDDYCILGKICEHRRF